MTGLEALTNELSQELEQNLAAEELELKEELKILDEQRTQLEQANLALVEQLERLQATQRKVDKLDDPEAYMNQLRENLEEDRLSTEAKEDVLAAVTAIIKDVDEINNALTETITEYREGMEEFEQGLAGLREDGQPS
jgi:phosphoglycerate dehydrogenase-like enzyme